MAKGTTTVGECGVPLVRLGVALIIALVGFSIAVMGFVMDSTTMIVGGSGLERGQWTGDRGLPMAPP
jgi:hypothetical protein